MNLRGNGRIKHSLACPQFLSIVKLSFICLGVSYSKKIEGKRLSLVCRNAASIRSMLTEKPRRPWVVSTGTRTTFPGNHASNFLGFKNHSKWNLKKARGMILALLLFALNPNKEEL